MTKKTAPPDVRDIITEFTGFEIIALLSGTGTDAALRTREMLNLPAVEADSPTVGIGMSTLIARGKVTTDDGVRPVGEAAAFAGICAAATEWIEVATVTEKSKSVALFVSAPGATIFLEPAPYGLWNVWPVKSDIPVARAAAGYVNGIFEKEDTALLGKAPFGASFEVTRASGPVRTAAVKIDAEGTWRLQVGELDKPQPPETIAADPTFAVLAEAVAA